MAPQTMTAAAPFIQGVQAPNVAVDPSLFFAATRRMRFQMRSATAISGLGSTDSVQLRQTGIIERLELAVTGSVVFGGTITGTSMSFQWPFNVAKNIKLSANGQSNLINCRGLSIRAYEFMANAKIDDNGLAATFGSTAVTSGTLKMAVDDWGTSGVNALNPGATVAAIGTYTVDIRYHIPVAADPIALIGAVYAQSSATNLSLDIDWEQQALLMTLGGSATFAQSLNWQVTGRAFSIPQVNNQFVVPDLSQFHQIAEFRQGGQSQGTNSINLAGTGTGRHLMRVWWQQLTGAAPGTPLALNAANYGQVNWAYGGSDTPEAYPTGQGLRADNYRIAGADLGGNWGIGLWDFASIFAARDLVDEAATSDLRIEYSLVASPTTPAAQTCQEVLFAAPAGA
jgi:hypothetical protein